LLCCYVAMLLCCVALLDLFPLANLGGVLCIIIIVVVVVHYYYCSALLLVRVVVLSDCCFAIAGLSHYCVPRIGRGYDTRNLGER
jgi:hypothetical protein